jgi:hypothetical protein
MSSVQVFSNLSVFREIAEHAFQEMEIQIASHRIARGDGGFILHHDPDRRSFKSGLVAIAFCSAYLDLICRISYIAKFGSAPDYAWDNRQIYEEKLKSLGIVDSAVLSDCTEFREARNDVMHEKPIVMGQTKPSPRGTAQDAASVGIRLIRSLSEHFKTEEAHD